MISDSVYLIFEKKVPVLVSLVLSCKVPHYSGFESSFNTILSRKAGLHLPGVGVGLPIALVCSGRYSLG